MFRRAVAPACTVGVQARSIYEYKFGQTPLTKPFTPAGARRGAAPAAPSSDAAAAPAAGKAQVTKLHNGARVITQQVGGPIVSVGAYILAGPAYDPPQYPGIGSMMHLALTTSNFDNSLFQLDRNIRSVGAAEEHFDLYKHYIGIRIDARPDTWKAPEQKGRAGKGAESASRPVNLVQDNIFTCIAAPRFHETDIERFRDTIDNQLQELRWRYPADYAKKVLETVAFYREPLGNPSFVPEHSNGSISSDALLAQYARYVTPERIVIAGVNVDHADLIAEYENAPFPHSAQAPHHQRAEKMAPVNAADEARQYTGGERQDHEDRGKAMGTKPDMATETICAVGWLAPGRDAKSLKNHAAAMVTKSILDAAFRDGVRYNKDETHIHAGVRAFYSPFNTAGLIGFTATAEPKAAVKMVTDTASIVQGKKAPAQAEVDAAKMRAATEYVNTHTDSIRSYCDFLGTSLSVTDVASTKNIVVEEVLEAIKSVSAADVKKVMDGMLSQPTSFYGHGEMLGFPSKRQMGL